MQIKLKNNIISIVLPFVFCLSHQGRIVTLWRTENFSELLFYIKLKFTLFKKDSEALLNRHFTKKIILYYKIIYKECID